MWSPESGTAALEITVMEAVSAEIRHCCLGCMWGIYQHYCTLRTQGDVKGFTKTLSSEGALLPPQNDTSTAVTPHGVETFVRGEAFHAGKQGGGVSPSYLMCISENHIKKRVMEVQTFGGKKLNQESVYIERFAE